MIWGTMMTSKTKKKRSNSFFICAQNSFSPRNTIRFVRAQIALITFASLLCAANAAWAAPAAQFPATSRAHDFLIFATVFTDQGLALYGVHTRLRRLEEKKFRREATSDHQGELAYRVPKGAQYEMTIEARGFKTQTRKIDATQDLRADLTIRMEPSATPHAASATGGKP
jgi:hypothetical protein